MTHAHWIEQAVWALSGAGALAAAVIAVVAVATWANA